MEDVREITLRLGILASSVISSSVMASAKYSCAGSRERFSRGRTASEVIAAASLSRTKRLYSKYMPTQTRNAPQAEKPIALVRADAEVRASVRTAASLSGISGGAEL